MSAVSVCHIFYGVHMGFSHQGLSEIMHESAGKDSLDKGEVALFVNKGWTACKLLAANGSLLYHRSSAVLGLESIQYLPVAFGGSKLAFTKNLEAHLIKAFETVHGKVMKKRKLEAA